MQELASERWKAVLGHLSGRVSPKSFETWFASVEPISFTEEQLELGVANRFVKEWLNDHYMPIVREAIGAATGLKPDVTLVVSGKAFRKMRQKQERELELPETPRVVAPPRPAMGQPLHGEFRLDNFVVGPSNRLVFSACQTVTENPGDGFNPLFIYGGAGLGKTHLLQGVCRALREKDPAASVAYVWCEDFLNDFVGGLQAGKLDEFRNHYMRLDVLVVDDIHFLGAKERTQEEFLHTFDALRNTGKQVVLSSDAHAKEIAALKNKLVTRFVSGLVARLSPPMFETRLSILRQKAARRGLEIAEALLAEIARRVETNVRELEGALAKVAALSAMEGRSPDVGLVRAALRELATSREGPVSLGEILDAVESVFGVSGSDVRSRKRSRRVIRPRQVAMYVAKRLTEHSLAEVGAFLGKRDHATVIHAGKRVAEEIKKDPALRRAVEDVFKALGRPAPW